MPYHVMGLDPELTNEVRSTLLSPGYGHPVVREVAKGTGPCRACLREFRVGEEERLLFTYRPRGGDGTLGAPGPVFIHADACEQYRGETFSPHLQCMPMVLEGWANGNRIIDAVRVSGAEVDAAVERMLANADVAYVHVRHGVAGCHIARVDRGPLPAQCGSAEMACARTA